jgi:anti-anti-sigma factor
MRVATLTIRSSTDRGRTVLSVEGELDLDTVTQLREPAEAALASGQGQALSLDLAEMTFIDSSGLALLVELRRLCNAAGVQFEISNVRSGPRRVIAIAGLTETLGLPPP